MLLPELLLFKLSKLDSESIDDLGIIGTLVPVIGMLVPVIGMLVPDIGMLVPVIGTVFVTGGTLELDGFEEGLEFEFF